MVPNVASGQPGNYPANELFLSKQGYPLAFHHAVHWEDMLVIEVVPR